MLAVYVDESCADGNNRYMVHGALFLRDGQVTALREALAKNFAESGLTCEMKWSGLSKHKLPRERSAIDSYFSGCAALPWAEGYRYQCLVVDQHKVDVAGFHSGDKDMCFYKFLYPLLRKRIGEFGKPDEEVNVVLDQRNTKRYDLKELKASLNSGLRLDKGTGRSIIRNVVYRDSRSDHLLQLSDVLTGAVGFYQNGCHQRASTSAHKLALARYIAKKAVANDLGAAQRRDDALGIWTLQMQSRKKEGPTI